MPAMRFDVLTLFPDIFQGYLGQSLLKRAIDVGPGGGPPARHPRLVQGKTQYGRRSPLRGRARHGDEGRAGRRVRRSGAEPRPGPRPLGDAHAARTPASTSRPWRELARHKRMILLCGRYEGFDERIRLDPRAGRNFDRRLRAQRGRGRRHGDHRNDDPARAGRVGRRRQQRERFVFGPPAVAGVCPVHAAAGVSRPRSAAGAVEREPRGNRPLERRKQPPADAGAAKD